MRLSVHVMPHERVVDAMRRVMGWWFGDLDTLADLKTWIRTDNRRRRT